MRIRDNAAKYKIYSDGYSLSDLRNRAKSLKKGLKELTDFMNSCFANDSSGFNPTAYSEMVSKPISKLSKPELVVHAVELQNTIEFTIQYLKNKEHQETKISLEAFINLAEKY